MQPRKQVTKTFPIGVCYCGCGAVVSNRSKFVRGHDSKLAHRVITEQYGDVADFAVAHGYRPTPRTA